MTDPGHPALAVEPLTALLLAIGPLAVLPLAWLLDLAFGEPRNALHPVAWLGRVLAPVGRVLLLPPAHLAFVGGAVVWCAGAAALGVAAWWLEGWLQQLMPWVGVPLLALLLKPTFAWRMLRDEVVEVEQALDRSLDAGRARLARIVSREVGTLDAVAVRESAIESLAENLNDALVAPLFWYAIAGLPGAVVYRFANTLDAMWGYRGRWEWAGKWAARADDLLSWCPARLSAALLRPCWRPSDWRVLRMQARSTPSPNSGWPMAAMALRLGIRLRKPGVYVLNPTGSAATPELLHDAVARAGKAAWTAVGLAMLARAGGAMA